MRAPNTDLRLIDGAGRFLCCRTHALPFGVLRPSFLAAYFAQFRLMDMKRQCTM